MAMSFHYVWSGMMIEMTRNHNATLIVTLTRPRTEDELRAELARVEAEIAKRKNGKVVSLHAVGGKDGEIPVAG